MIIYPDNYNPISEYWEKIRTGEVTVNNKVYQVYKKLNYDIENPGQYHYDCKRGKHIIEFAENFCYHSKGKFGGTKVKLELWEKAFLSALFGFVDDDGNRKYNLGVLIVAKKNGKSLIASIVGLYMLIADGEAGPEIYAVATKRDQAKIIWQEAKRMVKKSKILLSKIKATTYELSSEDYNCGVFKPLASDSDTLDGLNVHCALMDELHQWKNGRALFDIIADGTIGRDQPLVLITTTAGYIREDIYDEIYEEAKKQINGLFDPMGYKDEHSLYIIYELDSKEEIDNPNAWYKANPGLGTIKSYKNLESKVLKAKENQSLLKNLYCKDFNIPETSKAAFLTYDELNNEKTFNISEMKPRYGIGGSDLSSTTDLTSAKVLFMVPGYEEIYVLSMYWIPEDNLDKKIREDKIPYDKWIEQGFMRTCPGNRINPGVVTDWFLEVQNQADCYLYKIGYDRWSAEMWVRQMRETFGTDVMEDVAQGVQTLSNPMKCLRADFQKHLIVYNNNPVDKWCFANTSYKEDTNGNIQPCKTVKRTRRIDGFASLLDAYVILEKYREEYLTMI
ncbi:MAG: terminase large subunit [Ruminococcus sp.]